MDTHTETETVVSRGRRKILDFPFYIDSPIGGIRWIRLHQITSHTGTRPFYSSRLVVERSFVARSEVNRKKKIKGGLLHPCATLLCEKEKVTSGGRREARPEAFKRFSRFCVNPLPFVLKRQTTKEQGKREKNR